MTPNQAYRAMFIFLDDRYSKLPSDALGALLGELTQLHDGKPADPAIDADWQRAVRLATAEKTS